jgi:hypothetical protein
MLLRFSSELFGGIWVASPLAASAAKDRNSLPEEGLEPTHPDTDTGF